MSTYAASIGPLNFGFAGAVSARLPQLQPVSTFTADGETLLALEENGRYFLVIDHRQLENGPARVEFWQPCGACEGPIEGLFVLCDSLRPSTPMQHPSGFDALARFLTASAV